MAGPLTCRGPLKSQDTVISLGSVRNGHHHRIRVPIHAVLEGQPVHCDFLSILFAVCFKIFTYMAIITKYAFQVLALRSILGLFLEV